MASDVVSTGPAAGRDRGFTLVELLIVVVLLGTIMSALSAVIVTALRTIPSAEARVDDAHSVQGLVTWLPQDVDATPPDGFDRDPSAWPCSGSAAADSHNVLTLRWTERANVTTNYAASYRYEPKGAGWTMARYVCVNGGAAARVNLTTELTKPWSPADPPASTVMCRTAVNNSYTGDCPAIDTFPQSETAPFPVRSLKLFLDVKDGYTITIDAAPKNPDQTLADDPDATTNQPPTVNNPSITLSLAPNETKSFTLSDYFTVDDPDGVEAAVTVSIDPTEALPSNIVSATPPAYQYELTLTAGPNPGTSSTPLWLIVSDERGGWAVVQATIVVIAPPNVAPWLTTGDPSTRAISLPANIGTVTIDTTSIFNIQDDAPLDQLKAFITVAQSGTPPVDLTEVSVAETGSADVDVIFGPGVASSIGGLLEVDLEIHDVDGGVLPLHLTIEVLPVNSNDSPQAANNPIAATLEAGGASLILDVADLSNPAGPQVSDPDPGDILTATVLLPLPDGISASANGTTVTITADPAATPGPTATPLLIRVADLEGASVDVTVSITVTAAPPPPSNCVLKTLTASPSTVDRQGNGSAAHKLSASVTVTLTYTGTCDGLRLNYDSGDPSGLGLGVGRVFPPGSPSSILIVGNGTGGTEQFKPGALPLTASTSSAITPNSITTILNVS